MSIERKDIDDLVENGLVRDIFRVERAYELLLNIGKRADQLNDRRQGNYGNLFGALQLALQTESILAASRIFDTPSKKYPTRCLKEVLNFLTHKQRELPSIREPYQLQITLHSINAPQYLIGVVTSEPEEFASKFSAFIFSLLDTPSRIDALEKLKTLRDKSSAHNEQAKEISGPTWESLQDLIRIAKNVVGVLGWAYLSTAYMINGEYILTNDARRPAIALNRLLNSVFN